MTARSIIFKIFCFKWMDTYMQIRAHAYPCYWQ